MKVSEYKEQRNKIAKKNPKYKEGDFVKVKVTTVLRNSYSWEPKELSRTTNGKKEYMDYGELTGKVLSVDVERAPFDLDVNFKYNVFVIVDCDETKEVNRPPWDDCKGIKDNGVYLRGIDEIWLEREDDGVVREFEPTPRVVRKTVFLEFDDGKTGSYKEDVDNNSRSYQRIAEFLLR